MVVAEINRAIITFSASCHFAIRFPPEFYISDENWDSENKRFSRYHVIVLMQY